MKIIDLWIEDYNLLQNFNIELNEQLIVLIGQNGSGKSTLLEFIAKIFYDLYEHFVLEKGQKPERDFKLVYELEHNNSIYKIRIVRSSTQNEYYAVSYFKDGIWKEKQSRAKIEEEFMNGYKDMLPHNIVMYYSGISKNLENMIYEDGCGGSFNPYGNTVLLKGTAMIMNIVKNIFDGKKYEKNPLFSVKNYFEESISYTERFFRREDEPYENYEYIVERCECCDK